MVSYAYALEKGTQGLIFATPIGLNTLDLAIKLSLNKLLEIMKALKNFRFMLQKVNPSKLTIIINKT